jgi:hypothetical protein
VAIQVEVIVKFLPVAGEAMHNYVAELFAHFAQDPEKIIVGVPHVKEQGQAGVHADAELPLKSIPLLIPRRKIAKVVKAGLAYSNNFGFRSQLPQQGLGVIVKFGCTVRVHTRSGKQLPRMLAGKLQGGFAAIFTGAGYDHLGYPGFVCQLQYVSPVAVERIVGQVTADIYKFHGAHSSGFMPYCHGTLALLSEVGRIS